MRSCGRFRLSHSALVVIFVLAFGVSGRGQKPEFVSRLHEEGTRVPPSTLAEMVQDSDLVALAKVDRESEVVAHDDALEIPIVVTFRKLEIREVLHTKDPNVVAGTVVRVMQLGGTLEQPHRRVRQEVVDQITLPPGREFVVFLRWADSEQAYVGAWGSASSFWKLQDEAVRVVNGEAVAMRQNGRSLHKVLEELRNLSSK